MSHDRLFEAFYAHLTWAWLGPSYLREESEAKIAAMLPKDRQLDEAFVERLFAALEDSAYHNAALRLLTKLRVRAVGPTAKRILRTNTDPFICSTAALALVACDDFEGFAALERMVREGKGDVLNIRAALEEDIGSKAAFEFSAKLKTLAQ